MLCINKSAGRCLYPCNECLAILLRQIKTYVPALFLFIATVFRGERKGGLIQTDYDEKSLSQNNGGNNNGVIATMSEARG